MGHRIEHATCFAYVAEATQILDPGGVAREIVCWIRAHRKGEIRQGSKKRVMQGKRVMDGAAPSQANHHIRNIFTARERETERVGLKEEKNKVGVRLVKEALARRTRSSAGVERRRRQRFVAGILKSGFVWFDRTNLKSTINGKIAIILICMTSAQVIWIFCSLNLNYLPL